jgi:NAD(P)-dependent dehydrogenase (short-subunit alcohol dehydrogenase family)
MDRAVVITGASSGIGRATALHLAADGWRVFAGVRREEDGNALAQGSRGIEPVLLDVTDADSVRAAADHIAAAVGDGGLQGLVNNAGIAVAGPLELIGLDDFRAQFEVNVVGVVAVTQALLPLVRAGHGRIVNVSSIGGRVALPLAGPYAASKFAVEALSDSLRRELRPWGIEVSVVNPGAVATPIWDKGDAAAEAQLAAIPPEGRALYGDAMDAMRRVAMREGRNGAPPEKIAERIHHALTASRPRTRYLVGASTKARVLAQRVLGDRRFDAVVARAVRG